MLVEQMFVSVCNVLHLCQVSQQLLTAMRESGCTLYIAVGETVRLEPHGAHWKTLVCRFQFCSVNSLRLGDSTVIKFWATLPGLEARLRYLLAV